MADTKTKKKKTAGPANPTIAPGIYRYSRGTMYHKRGAYIRKTKATKKEVKKPVSVPRMKEVPLKGAKNGEKRMVRIKKMPAYYATELKFKKKPSRHFFSTHKRSLRPTLKPGTVCIVLAGIHKGKKVVFLKQLKTGLCLITGPFKVNRCPLRRVNQNYLIATQTSLDVSAVKIPDNVDDKFFARKKDKRGKKDDVFEDKPEKYTASEDRKKAQLDVDNQLLKAIKAREDKNFMLAYLKSMFGLRNTQFPHLMKF